MEQPRTAKSGEYVIRVEAGKTQGDPNDGSGENPQKKTNSRNQIRGVHGKQVMNFPLRSLAAFGMGVRFSRQFNQLAGEYTGRKMRTQQINSAIQIGTMAIGAIKFGPLGIAYASVNTGIQIASHRIENSVQNNKADIAHSRSGNNTRGRSRHGGAKL